MGYPVPRFPPPPPPTIDLYDTYDIDRRRTLPKPPSWFEGEKGSPSYWHAVTMEEKRQALEDEWNEKRDRVSYFWKVVAAIAIAVAVAIAFL